MRTFSCSPLIIVIVFYAFSSSHKRVFSHFFCLLFPSFVKYLVNSWYDYSSLIPFRCLTLFVGARNLRRNFQRMIRVLLFVFIWIVWLVAVTVSSGSVTPIMKSSCRDSCEKSKVKIPFPFGIGAKCYHNPWYEIVCNSSSSSSGAQIPVLKKFNLEVLSIKSCLDSTTTTDDYDFFDTCSVYRLELEVASYWHEVCSSSIVNHSSPQVVQSVDLRGSPFMVSTINNVVMAKGCPGYVKVTDPSGQLVGGCSSICKKSNATAERGRKGSLCDGLGCCLASLKQVAFAVDYYQIGLTTDVGDTCMKVAMVWDSLDIAEGLFTGPFSTLWHWMPPPLPNGTSDPPTSNFNCSSNCETNANGEPCLPFCTCSNPYKGNPYIPNGCQDPCKLVTSDCKGKKLMKLATILGLTIGLGSVILLLCCYGLYLLIRRRMQIKRKNKFFKRNGGLLLQQQMTSSEGGVERTKIFTVEELEKATDYFSVNRVLGQGGQGTVYKGMLPDGGIVAIKKSKEVDEGQVEQFINEVAILSQINHRNVVKLQGCCLETEVPLLVYEFIQNGALSEHIHNPSDDFHITWSMRLLIAAESAEAIAYLHSSSATPIYHRDIKSSNILLDDKYRAKVSDFGTSRNFLIDQTHLTTCVQGTFGYLDPEYFRSHQFTEKSDVYSFGVVLVELLTGKKPVTTTESGELKSLTLEFLFNMENSSLFEILDRRVLENAKEEEIMSVANLAKHCLNLNGKLRPTMKEVANALEAIRSPNFSSALEKIYAEDDKVVMDISRLHSGYVSSNTFCTEDGVILSDSVETQSLMHNTL